MTSDNLPLSFHISGTLVGVGPGVLSAAATGSSLPEPSGEPTAFPGVPAPVGSMSPPTHLTNKTKNPLLEMTTSVGTGTTPPP